MTNKDYEFRDSIKQAIKEALNETTLKIQVIADKPSGEWISVNERLPEDYNEVLCWYEYYHWRQKKYCQNTV